MANPWSVVRVVAYIVIGVALSRRVLDRLPPRRFWTEERRALGLGLGLWVLDLVMKAFLAPRWPALLRSLF